MNIRQLCRVFVNDTSQSANIHLLKFSILLHIFEQSASVKADVNKLFQKYQIDCLFKQNCLVGNQTFKPNKALEALTACELSLVKEYF
jgi:hypothetical protein